MLKCDGQTYRMIDDEEVISVCQLSFMQKVKIQSVKQHTGNKKILVKTKKSEVVDLKKISCCIYELNCIRRSE